MHVAAGAIPLHAQMGVVVLPGAGAAQVEEDLDRFPDGRAADRAEIAFVGQQAVFGEYRRIGLRIAAVVGPGIAGEQVEDVEPILGGHAHLRELLTTLRLTSPSPGPLG